VWTPALVKTKTGAFKMKVSDDVLAGAPRTAVASIDLDQGTLLSHLKDRVHQRRRLGVRGCPRTLTQRCYASGPASSRGSRQLSARDSRRLTRG